MHEEKPLHVGKLHVGDRVFADGAEGMVYKINEEKGAATIKFDMLKTGSGEVINEPPYNGKTGWSVNLTGAGTWNYGLKMLVPADINNINNSVESKRLRVRGNVPHIVVKVCAVEIPYDGLASKLRRLSRTMEHSVDGVVHRFNGIDFTIRDVKELLAWLEDREPKKRRAPKARRNK